MNTTLTRTILPFTLAIAFGCFAVSVDLHNSEPQAAALVLIVGGVLVGGLWPNHAWRWGLVLGLSIFIGDPIGVQMGITPPWPEQGINWGSLVALVPAFVGTYVGVGVRALAGAAMKSV